MQKLNHVAWGWGEDVCFYVSTEKHSSSCFGAAQFLQGICKYLMYLNLACWILHRVSLCLTCSISTVLLGFEREQVPCPGRWACPSSGLELSSLSCSNIPWRLETFGVFGTRAWEQDTLSVEVVCRGCLHSQKQTHFPFIVQSSGQVRNEVA